MDWLETLFLVCIGFGLIYAVLLLLFGDHTTGWLSHFHLPVLQPLTWVSGLTAFGGAGFLLLQFSSFSRAMVSLLAVMIGITLAVLSYFIWIRPMQHSENSTGYSIGELVGKIGEVWTTIPPQGIGEVLIVMVNGTTNHMAASLEGETIPEGTRVVVVKVVEHVLYVTPFQ